MIKGIIFDMDGTILNTIDDITDSINYAFLLKGHLTHCVKEVKKAVGSGAYEMIEELAPKKLTKIDILELCQTFQKHYDTNKDNKTAPYEGILPLLDTLKKQGYKLAVVSNKLEYLVKELNKKLFNEYFNVSIGDTPEIPLKPAPDMLYQALNILKLKKEEVLFVGDSDIDMLTATNAKITSVGVTWGFRDKKTLVKYQATHIIDHPNELMPLLERIKKL